MELVLNILKEDIMNTNYMNTYDCAITRAIRRAGLPNGCDNGISMILYYNKKAPTDKERAVLYWYTDQEKVDLALRVSNMYCRKDGMEKGSNGEVLHEPEDFTCTLCIPDELFKDMK